VEEKCENKMLKKRIEKEKRIGCTFFDAYVSNSLIVILTFSFLSPAHDRSVLASLSLVSLLKQKNRNWFDLFRRVIHSEKKETENTVNNI
jgi:hypothetical protein